MLATGLRATHRFLLRRAFYPLVLTSALAVATYAGRVWLSDSLTFRFLVWNLVLAWLPYGASLWAEVELRRAPAWRAVVPSLLWLLFFPNAPYILTDFIHLSQPRDFHLWYDVGMIAAFALAGCFLAVASLDVMQRLVRERAGAVAGWLFALSCAGLAGLGVYLGRFLRWNSWDMLLTPRAVLGDLLAVLGDPAQRRESIAASALFAALLLACYVMYSSSGRVRAREAAARRA